MGKKVSRFPITLKHIWKYKNIEYDIVKTGGKKRITLLEDAYGLKLPGVVRELLVDLSESGGNYGGWDSDNDVIRVLQTIYPLRNESIFDSLLEELHLHIPVYYRSDTDLDDFYLSDHDVLLGFFFNTMLVGIPNRHESVRIQADVDKPSKYIKQLRQTRQIFTDNFKEYNCRKHD